MTTDSGDGVPATSSPGTATELLAPAGLLAKWVETVVAPLGAVTALLIFFGWTRSGSFYEYFGIHQGLLQYSLQDHVLRSADSTFGTTARLLAIVIGPFPIL